MNNKNKVLALLKILLGLLFVIGGLPALINGLVIVLGAIISKDEDSYHQGLAFGNFTGALIVWILALWSTISGFKQRRRIKNLDKNSNPE
ncbi:MAG: hypothetical protein NTV81_04810 [Candidatus Komeilibacteria bacterium]|nr:hypothetical protein [Candidatus Komeilibacteria bacterium]